MLPSRSLPVAGQLFIKQDNVRDLLPCSLLLWKEIALIFPSLFESDCNGTQQ